MCSYILATFNQNKHWRKKRCCLTYISRKILGLVGKITVEKQNLPHVWTQRPRIPWLGVGAGISVSKHGQCSHRSTVNLPPILPRGDLVPWTEEGKGTIQPLQGLLGTISISHLMLTTGDSNFRNSPTVRVWTHGDQALQWVPEGLSCCHFPRMYTSNR